MFRTTLYLLLGLICLAPFSAARAGGDPYAVSGIAVDATASSATQAQNIAIVSGRARAWATLSHRLTKAADWPHLPALDDTAITRLIRSYQFANERRSTTRYTADITYVFNPDAVRHLFRTANIAYADMQAKPILVVPMSPGYAPHAAWTSIWANPKYATGATPLMLPVGDSLDSASLSALNFSTATWQDVEPVASRAHATEAFLVQVSQGKGTLDIKLKRLGPGNSPPMPDVVVPITPGTPGPKVYASGADAAASAIIDEWKARSAIDFGRRNKLIVEVRIEDLAGWSALLQKLGTIPNITDVAVVAMNTGEARVALTYVGSQDQLHDLLAQATFDLSNQNGTWWLGPPGSADASTQ